MNIQIKPLGQVGFYIKFGQFNVYIDPYLSNSVQEKENSEISRLVPIPEAPEGIIDSDFVLLTHDHRDHCDDDTLTPMANASKSCLFIGPHKVIQKLQQLGFEENRFLLAKATLQLSNDITIHVVPSAHPIVEKNAQSGWNAIGYIIEYKGIKIYHAGDTSLCDEVIESVQVFGDIDIAMIPVNERNYMRDKQGIIGNMSVREAFYFAERIGAETLIPTHWDMFAQNQVYQEEIELLYQKLKPDFEISFGEIILNESC